MPTASPSASCSSAAIPTWTLAGKGPFAIMSYPSGLAERSHAQYHAGTDLREMITENLIAERIAIESYREIVQFIGERDPTTRRLLEDILAAEEEHADDLVDLLDGDPVAAAPR